MKSLVLAEKPSVARDIARVLKCGGNSGGYLESQRYVVTWALGHLVTLAEPESYDDKYKSWKLEDLPLVPKKMELTVIRQTAKQYGIVKNLLKRNDITEIIIATDAGREGELVARWILEKAGSKKPVKRLWVSSVTDKAISDGFKSLKNGSEYINLYNSAQARAISDWLVGINATRALTTKFNVQLSCGRVQTPTLALVKAREDEIRGFAPQKYYGVAALAEGVNFTWRDKKNNDARIFDKSLCDKLTASIKDKNIEVKSIEKRLKKSFSKQLYDLTELQRDANRMYSFSAKETLNIMQGLYESHKVLTYPRTDSRYITQDIVPTIPERLRTIGGEYGKIAFRLIREGIKPDKSFVDEKKVSDHHAIIPTEQPAFPDKMTDKERKIYNLVIKRFLSVLLPPCEYEEVSVTAEIEGERFTARGKRIIKQGYREVDASADGDEPGENEEKEQSLPDFKKGAYKVSLIKVTEDRTKPPKPFTEATLLSAMENPSKYVKISGDGLAKTLSETGGLGTVATRADIIEKLFDSFSLEKRGNDIFVTSKGKQLLTLVPPDLKEPALTAKWERELIKISKGEKDKNLFIGDITAYTRRIIEEIKSSSEVYRHDNITNHKCPECGKNMLEVNGKKGKMLVCRDRECGFRKTVSVITNARCPVCHKKLELAGDGENKRFVCVCGHSEKMSSFKARREAEGGNVSKKDVESYMRKQGKDSKEEKNINSALADALKGLKFE